MRTPSSRNRRRSSSLHVKGRGMVDLLPEGVVLLIMWGDGRTVRSMCPTALF
jgi:hypothetical protein